MLVIKVKNKIYLACLLTIFLKFLTTKVEKGNLTDDKSFYQQVDIQLKKNEKTFL